LDGQPRSGPTRQSCHAPVSGIDAQLIIDLGCGTGLLTRSLARLGRTVIGVDPSPTMLDYARQQPGSESVTWIHGDASALAPTGTADLVLCTGNAIMHVSPEELPAALASVAAALPRAAGLTRGRPGGGPCAETAVSLHHVAGVRLNLMCRFSNGGK
jgi:SAM-dependent methyltransferase